MSNKKAKIIDEIKIKLEIKYGKGNADVMKLIEEEISKIKQKPKLQIEDLNELEDKLALNCKRILSRDVGRSLYLPSLASQDFSPAKFTTAESTISNLRQSITYPKPNIDHISPYNLGIIKKYSGLPDSSPIGKPEMQSFDKKLAEAYASFRDTTSDTKQEIKTPFKRSIELMKTKNIQERTIEREKILKENIWNKLDQFNHSKQMKEEEMRIKKAREDKEKWIHELNKQREELKNKKFETKAKERNDANVMIIESLKEEEKRYHSEKNHKDFLRSDLKISYRDSLEAAELKRLQLANKIKEDARIVEEKIQDYKDYVAAKKLKKKMDQDDYREWQNDLCKIKNLSKERNKIVDLELEVENHAIQEKAAEKIELEKTNLVNKIKAKVLKDDKKFESTASEKIQNTDISSPQGLSFIFNFENTPEAKLKKKESERIIMQAGLNTQLAEKSVREREEKFLKTHAITEEEPNRDELEKQAEKIKKMILKNDLDSQIQYNKELKSKHDVTELWVNRKTLKEMGVRPKGYEHYFGIQREVTSHF